MKAKNIRRLITIVLVAALFIIFSATADYFLNVRNITQMLREAAYTGILAVGMSFVMVGGGIDLSLGGIVCATGIICERFANMGVPGIVVLFIGLAFGLGFGVINSFLVTKLHMTEFVATLSSGMVYSGLAIILAYRDSSSIISVRVTNDSVSAFGKAVGPFYWITIIWIIVTVLAMVLQQMTVFGKYNYACGSNVKSAEMSGINCESIKRKGYLISGALSGVTAFLVLSNEGAATIYLGSGMEFQAIAACVVGGIAMSGGRGDALGAALGALFLAVLSNGLNKFGLASSWQYIYQGAIIIIATAFDAFFQVAMRERRKKVLPPPDKKPVEPKIDEWRAS